jgi:hypothetical protein
MYLVGAFFKEDVYKLRVFEEVLEVHNMGVGKGFVDFDF